MNHILVTQLHSKRSRGSEKFCDPSRGFEIVSANRHLKAGVSAETSILGNDEVLCGMLSPSFPSRAPSSPEADRHGSSERRRVKRKRR